MAIYVKRKQALIPATTGFRFYSKRLGVSRPKVLKLHAVNSQSQHCVYMQRRDSWMALSGTCCLPSITSRFKTSTVCSLNQFSAKNFWTSKCHVSVFWTSTDGKCIRFSALIDKQARGALATEMFERFSNELCSTREEAPIVKKQKKKSRSARPRASSVARTVATLFAQFIRALKINQQQKPIFKEHTSSLFRNFVYPSLNQPDDIEGKRIPALQIHMALVDSLPDVYWSELDPGTHEQLARIFQTMFLENTKKDGRANRIASVLSVSVSTAYGTSKWSCFWQHPQANAILQHIYHVCLRDPDAAICPLMESVHNILDFIFACQMEKASVWSGSLLDVHKDAAAALACWKLVTDEWFGVMW